MLIVRIYIYILFVKQYIILSIMFIELYYLKHHLFNINNQIICESFNELLVSLGS